METSTTAKAPAVSIVICTYNRATDLQQTLATLGSLCVPEDLPTELLVVDNGSTDNTRSLALSSALPNMPVRYLYEARRGKGYAYNSGMTEARGQVLLFTDDDVRPPKNWVSEMCRPILGGQSDALCGGVRLATHLERPWMEPLHRAYLAATELLNDDNPSTLIGANMAFAKRILGRVPLFDVRLGPGALGVCDETLFTYQLRAAGFSVHSAFGTIVEHHCDASRLLPSSFFDIARKSGRSLAYIDYHWEHKTVVKPASQLRFLMARTIYKRLKRSLTNSYNRVPKSQELVVFQEMHYHRQWLIEQKRPRCYEKHALIAKAFQS